MSLFLDNPDTLVVIGAGTGGPEIIREIIASIPKDYFGTIFVVQDLRPGFTRVFADQLNSLGTIPVAEPVDGERLARGKVYVAPGGCFISFRKMDQSLHNGLAVVLEETASKRGLIDAAMTSAADTFGANCIGILLSGLGTDGISGLRAISTAGGQTVALDELSARLFDLSRQAIASGVVKSVLSTTDIIDLILNQEGDANANAA